MLMNEENASTLDGEQDEAGKWLSDAFEFIPKRCNSRRFNPMAEKEDPRRLPS